MTTRPRCTRPGCTRRVPEHSDHTTCSHVCTTLHRITDENHRILTVIGTGPAADELTDAAQDMLDAYDDLLSIRSNLRHQALASGITAAAWSAIVRGQQ